MHESSMKLMGNLLRQLPDAREGSTVLDVGSYSVDGSYRELVESRGYRYVGMDVREGPNVDLCIPDITKLEGPYDHVISGQMLEHDPFPMLSVVAMKRVLREGGWLALIAPREWHTHRHPIDCWRFLPDGMVALLEGFEQITADTIGKDTYGMGRKPVCYVEPWRIERWA